MMMAQKKDFSQEQVVNNSTTLTIFGAIRAVIKDIIMAWIKKTFPQKHIPLIIYDTIWELKGLSQQDAKLAIRKKLADLTIFEIIFLEAKGLSPQYIKEAAREIVVNRVLLRVKWVKSWLSRVFITIDTLLAQLLVTLEGIKTRDYSWLKFWKKINWSKIKIPKINWSKVRLPKINLHWPKINWSKIKTPKIKWNDYYLALWGKIPWPKIKPEKQAKTRKVAARIKPKTKVKNKKKEHKLLWSWWKIPAITFIIFVIIFLVITVIMKISNHGGL